MGFGGSSGGSSSVAASTDVALNNPVNNEVLSYNSTTSKWINRTPSAAGAVVVKWNGTSWGTYSTSTNDVRMFLSQNDASATPPTYYSSFDLWYAHPDA